MSQSTFHYQCLLLFIIIKINCISGQTCEHFIPDFFYNVDFAGPIFSQSVYTTEPICVATPLNTPLFNFTVKPQTNYTRPSFVLSTATGRALGRASQNITVTTSDRNFAVMDLNSADGVYALVTNTTPLKYFSPFNRYVFKLIAKQTISNEQPPVTSTAIVQINLKNANVNCPIFVPESQIFYISQAAQPGTEFGTVYATDADNDAIIYSTSDTRFHIDRLTGVLRLEHPFDSSRQSEYWIEVKVTDNGSTCSSSTNSNRSCSTSTTIRIIVTTVNKNPPRFSGQICGTKVSLYENNIIGETVAELLVWDDDIGSNGWVNIAFPSEHLRTTVGGFRNTAYSQFYIEQMNQTNTTRMARLRANETFDYDTPGATRVWYLFILATDNGTPQRQAFCSLRIDLCDANDNAPVFIMTSWNFTITRTTTRFLRIIAADADSGSNGMIDYYIGTFNVPYFSINRTTGTIMLRSSVPGLGSLDASLFPITFVVYAQDRGSPPKISDNNATVNIYYKDGDEPLQAKWLDTSYEELNITITEKFYETHTNSPIFDISTGFNGSIYYNLTSQTSIMTVCSAYLNNKMIPFRDVQVEKVGEAFKSGIAVTRGLHAELQNVYFLYIRVLVNPPLIGSVTVNLKDENDQIPTFDIRSIVLSVVEKESGIRSIAQIQAFDRDVDHPNNFVEYRLNENLTDMGVNGLFFVASNGTIWTNATFDWNNKALYRLFITAYDGAPAWNSKTGEANTQDFQFDVEVISINDNPPRFINPTSVFNILETTVNGTDILYFNITDLDSDTYLNLGILSGNTQNAFTFTLLSNKSSPTGYEATGKLSVVGPLDYQLRSVYTLVLFAFDAKNMAQIDVTVNIIPQNTNAPRFELMPGFTSYSYQVYEGADSVLNGIRAIDPDSPATNIIYEVFNANHQLDISNLYLTQTGNSVAMVINLPGLSHDLPFGDSEYNIAIIATDENGSGVSSYVPVSITVIDVNNKAPIPIPTNGLWIIEEGINSTIDITFEDYDEPQLNNTLYRYDVVRPPEFKPTCPTITVNKTCKFVYIGELNRNSMKYFPVTFNTSDSQNVFKITTISIIVSDKSNTYPIYDGYKTINVIYVNGYQNSLRDVDLGSIYVKDLNDWYRAKRTYLLRKEKDGDKFDISQEFLRTSSTLDPGSYTARVDVTKSGPELPNTALSTIDVQVESVDSEYVRQASTIRIQGDYPETLIDPTFGPPLIKLRNALASLLSVAISTIKILTIRPVFQYRSPYYPPKDFELDKNETLTDVIFYIPGSDKYEVERTLNTKFNEFASRFGIRAVAIEPNPCSNYRCPTGTSCRPTRTILPKPAVIDTNQTSFVGINILDSADCVNSIYISNECRSFTSNNLPYCPSTSSLPYGPIGPCCEILGRTFDENGGGYARYSSARFSSFAPARFSFDFALRTLIPNGLILLYGRTSPPINDFFWIAIEIYQSRLRFHFRETIIDADRSILIEATWYHIECQFVDSTILVSVNDCQYRSISINDTLNTDDLSTVELYLGGLPTTDTLVSALYPSLTTVNTFNGCIRNVLSNGYYLDMNQKLSSAKSDLGACPCSVTKSCPQSQRVSIIPWYTWLIIALVLLLLATVLAMVLLTCIRRRQQLKILTTLYTDDTRDNIIDYKETAGEEDHSTYNLRLLKKPVYTVPTNETFGYSDLWDSYRPSLSNYIEQKLNEQIPSYANDTQLHYHYEGEGSITSDLSVIEPSPLHDEDEYMYLSSLGPKFSRLADLYTFDDVV